jgi:hypothetical protein
VGVKRRRNGSCEILRGIVHNLKLETDAGTFSFPLECHIVPVPKNGSCMLAAAARALARLDLPSLKEHDDLKEVDWGPVEAWCSFGRDLINEDDEDCLGLGERICRLLLENHNACAEYVNKRPMDISPNGDIDQNDFDSALRTARSMGLMGPGETADANDRMKQWAVVMLSPTCQCGEEVLRAVLDLDLKKQVGILCLSRHKKAHASHVSACVIHRPVSNHTLGAVYHSDDSVGPVTDMKKEN